MSSRTAVETIQAAIDRLEALRLRGQIDFGNPLFVTLHRTIDAQLAILADGLIVAKHWEDILEQVSGTMRTPINHALLLARAILGEAS